MSQNELKILLVAPLPPPIGGIASWTTIISTYQKILDSNTANLKVCNTAMKGRSATSISFIRRIFMGIINAFRVYYKLKKDVKSFKPNVIHLTSSASFSLLKDFLILRHARKKNIPVITHWHFGRIPTLAMNNNWEHKLLNKIVAKSAKSIVIDPRSFSTLSAAGHTNIINIPNPIPLAVEELARNVDQNYNQRPPSSLIFVGHIVAAKGVYELIQACVDIKEITNLTLVGPYEEQVKEDLSRIANKRDNGQWLNFLGLLPKNQVLDQMKKHAILILPSYTEGFPNVILEAMAMGCAVLATDVGAISEMLDISKANPCGICVQPRQVQELQNALYKMVNEKEITEKMGRNGINKVLDNYLLASIFSIYFQVWKSFKTENISR